MFEDDTQPSTRWTGICQAPDSFPANSDTIILLGYERACYHHEMPISVGGGTTANHSLPWVRWHVKNRPKASRWSDLLQGTPGLCALDRLPGPAIGLRWRRSAVDVISKAAGFQIVCSLPYLQDYLPLRLPLPLHQNHSSTQAFSGRKQPASTKAGEICGRRIDQLPPASSYMATLFAWTIHERRMRDKLEPLAQMHEN